ncbi:2Fe-2S iron-sulfur cluster binding domain-containing protein [Bradyrhizobium sp. KBS0727]|uniref:2Fe-2S iron-sulfur cluster-binding protein n=1 Tax=unclassified Bradyrhizobium TaxID=2631580 RepID=UPI00110DE311|nr:MULTISPECIES: 2Fe-2S iron-sulfur cluster-binding protein [unclassified Bradyrhizobium]QDW40568.1 2Fe-2S iron-sulfur cluster binding domain-containing protein [Bradyrhizobium sp. KBS0725]QDW47173.1 2Fe-2S iron-sulfur cluster binding domain-containing protein [Bradyrhizobium sp. KBS0727]
MTSVTYVEPDGRRRETLLQAGMSVMQGALHEGVDGIVAECGGNLMCATCHVYVDSAQLSALPAVTEEENALLDGVAAERRPNSRLSCQIKASDHLESLVVYLPSCQS